MRLKKYCYYALFILLFAVFCYFRLKPVLLQTVPYTFDQGRDFLRAHQLVHERDIAVFGPPTGGPTGLSHGVWWYYELAIPYILTGGHPSGFYWFIFFVNVISVLLFALFLCRVWGRISALLFLTILAPSPYFIQSAFFPINSVMTIPFILLLYYSIYHVLKNGSARHIFFTMVSAGFILEAEVPFGLFLYPAIILSLLFTKSIHRFISSGSRRKALIAGFLLPFVPRILAELVSNFRQTRGFYDFLFHSTEPINKGANILMERAGLFWDYYRSLFPLRDELTAWLVLGATAAGIVLGFFATGKFRRRYLIVTVSIPAAIFFLSLLSNKQLFWANYLEGIQYMFVMPILAAWHTLYTNRKIFIKTAALFIPLIFGISLYTGILSEVHAQGGVPLTGLRRHIATVAPIYEAESKNPAACVRVYTPPVIPHTYNYLFAYNELRGKTAITQDVTGNTCWFILEDDSCVFQPIEVAERKECKSRQSNWKKNQLNEKSKLMRTVAITGDVRLEQWQINP